MAQPAEAMFARDEASKRLGIELLGAGNGQATVRMTVTAEMVNGHAITHGGYVFILADTAFACACNSHGPVTVAASADIDFLRAKIAPGVMAVSVTSGIGMTTAFGLAPDVLDSL